MLNQKLKFGLFLIGLTALEAALTLWPARYSVTGHEGDMLHMLDMGLRMTAGELPHLDFMTPIGILGIAPVALFLGLGYGAVHSAVMADLLVLVLLLPALWWVGVTRFSGPMRFLFGGYIVVLLSALVFGGEITSLSLSLYYNRWAWGISFVMLATLLLRPKSPMAEAWVPAVVIGLSLAALALIKMTYFVSFAPAVVLILVAQKRFGLLLASIGAGAAVAVAVTAALGVDFVLAYKDNLFALAFGDVVRAHPTAAWIDVIGSPKTLVHSGVLLAAILLFRKSNRPEQGLALLILAPAFSYITYQNWGNDPKWLVFLVFYLLAFLPEQAAKRQAGLGMALVALTVITPSIITLASSPVRAIFASPEGRLPVPIDPRLADFLVSEQKVKGTDALINIIGIPAYVPENETPVAINGAELPACSTSNGGVNTVVRMSAQLDALPETRGKQILMADILNLLWLLGDQERVRGAAPWYYDDRSGFDAAQYFVVPNCPLDSRARNNMVRQMLTTGWRLEQRFASSLMAVYRIVKTDE